MQEKKTDSNYYYANTSQLACIYAPLLQKEALTFISQAIVLNVSMNSWIDSGIVCSTNL